MGESYWDGSKNKAIRWYFYSQRGLALFNEFRYLLMLIFGLYVLLKIQNPVWLVVMFLGCVPILVVCGWFQVNHMAKVINWLDVKYGSHWTLKSMEWQERSVKALEEINVKINK